MNNKKIKRKDIRLKNYNYKKDGYYFITLCTVLKKPLISKCYETVEKILLSMPNKINGVSIDYYSLMSNHIHVILLLNNTNILLGEIIRRFKALVTKETNIKPFWEWNYYEHVIRSEKALYNIRKYIQENPLKEKIEWNKIYVA